MELPHTSHTWTYWRLHEAQHRTVGRDERSHWAWRKWRHLPGYSVYRPATSQQWRHLSHRTQRGIFYGGISSSPWMPISEDCPWSYRFKCWTSSKDATRSIFKAFGGTCLGLNDWPARLEADTPSVMPMRLVQVCLPKTKATFLAHSSWYMCIQNVKICN